MGKQKPDTLICLNTSNRVFLLCLFFFCFEVHFFALLLALQVLLFLSKLFLYLLDDDLYDYISFRDIGNFMTPPTRCNSSLTEKFR